MLLGQDNIILKSGDVIDCRIVNADKYAVHYFPKNDNVVVPKSIPKKFILKIETTNKSLFSSKEIALHTKSIDTASYLKFGVIPYQVFGRSSGAYIGFSNKKLSLEYRYFYTYATNYYPPHSGNFAKFFYAGDNHNLLFTFYRKESVSFAVLAGYKSWSFSNKSVPLYDIYSMRRTSSHVQGFCAGFEYSKDLSKKKFHGEFFMGLSYSHLSGSYEYYGYGIQDGWQKHSRDYNMVHLAVGSKLGGRIKLKNNI